MSEENDQKKFADFFFTKELISDCQDLKSFYWKSFQNLQALIDQKELEIQRGGVDVRHLIEDQKCFVISTVGTQNLERIIQTFKYYRTLNRHQTNAVKKVSNFKILTGYKLGSSLQVNAVKIEQRNMYRVKGIYQFILVHFYSKNDISLDWISEEISKSIQIAKEKAIENQTYQVQQQGKQQRFKSKKEKDCSREDNYYVLQKKDYVNSQYEDERITQTDNSDNQGEDTMEQQSYQQDKNYTEQEYSINNNIIENPQEQLISNFEEIQQNIELQKKILELEDENAQNKIENIQKELRLLQNKRQLLQSQLKQKLSEENSEKEQQMNELSPSQMSKQQKYKNHKVSQFPVQSDESNQQQQVLFEEEVQYQNHIYNQKYKQRKQQLEKFNFNQIFLPQLSDYQDSMNSTDIQNYVNQNEVESAQNLNDSQNFINYSQNLFEDTFFNILNNTTTKQQKDFIMISDEENK